VVRDPAVHRTVLHAVADTAAESGLSLCGLARSPITGPAGNVEFLAWLQAGGQPVDITHVVREVVDT
jgi:23S rRNA (cytidine1920-2'-O)/16S rRNA (cytidine1409-2'-O)-methyltransferase